MPERHGLPPALDEWLFPPDGSSRDLTTLQVSLGHNDEFFAFDKYDRISHINTEFRDNASNAVHNCLSQPATSLSLSRRKSHTFSHWDETRGDERQDTAMHRRQLSKKKLRPRSIAIAGMLSMRPSHERNRSHDSQPLKAWPEVLSEEKRQNHPGRPRYAHAGVQTDPTEDQQIASRPCFHEMVSKPARSRDSSISILSDISSRTIDSGISLSSTSSAYLRNPISMGAMNRYFRESQYRLGDALTRASPIDIGAH